MRMLQQNTTGSFTPLGHPIDSGLNPRLKASEYVLLLLYERGRTGAALAELQSWVRPKMRSNLKTTIKRLVDDAALIHDDGEKLALTKRGIQEVEKKKLHANT